MVMLPLAQCSVVSAITGVVCVCVFVYCVNLNYLSNCCTLSTFICPTASTNILLCSLWNMWWEGHILSVEYVHVLLIQASSMHITRLHLRQGELSCQSVQGVVCVICVVCLCAQVLVYLHILCKILSYCHQTTLTHTRELIIYKDTHTYKHTEMASQV